jgi:uroporphyrinogen decarboxylase
MQFEPVCYEHAASLINKTPWEVSRQVDLLVEAQLAAMETHDYPASVVGVDIYNVEAEAYGCVLSPPPGKAMPAPHQPILEEVGEIHKLRLESKEGGRIPMILEAARRIQAGAPQARVRIPLAGPFTIASHLLGLEEIICEMYAETEDTVAALEHLARNQLVYAQAATDAGFAVTLFESSVAPPLLSPPLFQATVQPLLARLIAEIKARSQHGVELIIGGNTLEILGGLLATGADALIAPVETDQSAFMQRIPADHPARMRVNMRPGVFTHVDSAAALQEAQRAWEIARKYPRTSVGALMPYDAHPETVKAVTAFLGSKESLRRFRNP